MQRLTEWSQMLDLFDDANIYQTWSYGAVRWGRKNLSHLVLKRNGEVSEWRSSGSFARQDSSSAWRICGGALFVTGAEESLMPKSPRAWLAPCEEEYVCKRGLLLQILPNAFVGSPRAALFQSAFSRFTQEPPTSANMYRTFVLDLAPPLEELRKESRQEMAKPAHSVRKRTA